MLIARRKCDLFNSSNVHDNENVFTWGWNFPETRNRILPVTISRRRYKVSSKPFLHSGKGNSSFCLGQPKARKKADWSAPFCFSGVHTVRSCAYIYFLFIRSTWPRATCALRLHTSVQYSVSSLLYIFILKQHPSPNLRESYPFANYLLLEDP